MKIHSLDEVQDELIGKRGTNSREKFELDLQMEMIGLAIKKTRQERHLTQEELGKLVGVQKSQISKLENNSGNVTISTLIRVFSALKAKAVLQVELPHIHITAGQ